MTASKHLVTVIVPHWRGKTLPQCLTALREQTFSAFEVLVVDNSGQLTAGMVGEDCRLISVKHNLGFAAASNLAARQAHGEWIVLLNDDAFPQRDWLEHLQQVAEHHPEYHFFASRLIQARQPTLLDGAGDVYHISGLAWRRFYNKPTARYGLIQEEVFGPCGAAAMYHRDAFQEVGGFDEDYFSYHEDVDLAFRLRLKGYKCLYVPEAVVHHVGSASTGVKSDFAVYHGHRNLVWTFIKNMPAPLLLRYWPLHILFTIMLWTYYLAKGQGLVFLKAKRDALRQFPLTWQKRQKIQSEAHLTATEIHQHLSRDLLAPLRSRKV